MATQAVSRRQVEFPTHLTPHTEINTAQVVGIAIALTLVVFGAAYAIGGFLKDLLMGKTEILIERVVLQSTIVFVWSLSAATVVLKVLKINKERASLDESIFPDGLDLTNTEKLIEVYERIKSRSNIAESLGLTRVARVLAMWINTGDFARTSEYARNEAETTALASDGSFRRNRLFIWAMPLLGFVGTVFGVAAGISGFAAFLKQGNVTPEQIKEQVGFITQGLAVAFFCTLLGLLTAGLAAFPSLMAERKEENTLADIDEYVEDRMLSRMPSADTEAMRFPTEDLVQAIQEGMAGMQGQSKFPVEELAQAIDVGFRRLPNPDRYEEVFTRAIGKASDLINQKYEEFQTNYERRVGELGSQLGGKLEGVATGFNTGTQRMMAEFTKSQDKTLDQFTRNDEKLTERFDDLTEKLTTVGKEMAEQFGDANERYVEAVQDLDKKEIQRWEKMVADFNQLSVRLADSFKQAVSTMDSATARYADKVGESIKTLTGELENITRLLGTEIDKVLRTTQSMEATLRQVGSSDEFRQTLANIRSHLVTSDELLKQLSRPRKVVFQEARGDDSV